MKEELERAKNDSPEPNTYTVYKTPNGLFVESNICKQYDVGDTQISKRINGKKCLEVNEGEIKRITEKAKRQNKELIPYYESYFDIQDYLSFTVYVDENNNDELYISETLCKKYGIKSDKRKVIGENDYCQVSEKDIDKIEEQTRKEDVILKKKYEPIKKDDSILENQFTYFLDTQENKIYIQRDMYEEAKKNGIEIESIPRIIYEKNCYSITQQQLEELENKINIKGIEKIIKPNKNTKKERAMYS